MCFLLLQPCCASWDVTEGHLGAVPFRSDLSASASVCPGAVTLRPMATVLYSCQELLDVPAVSLELER